MSSGSRCRCHNASSPAPSTHAGVGTPRSPCARCRLSGHRLSATLLERVSPERGLLSFFGTKGTWCTTWLGWALKEAASFCCLSCSWSCSRGEGDSAESSPGPALFHSGASSPGPRILRSLISCSGQMPAAFCQLRTCQRQVGGVWRADPWAGQPGTGTNTHSVS